MEKRQPKRRFKDFQSRGDWEEKKLGEIVNRFDNLRVPISEYNRIPGKTPYYGANGIVDYVDGYTHDGEFVLMAEDGANDIKNYPIHYVCGKIWVNNHAHVIQDITNISNNIFLLYSLKSTDVSSSLVGGSRAKLNSDALMNIKIKIPPLEEQKKIGDFFQRLDRLIDLNRSRLDKLRKTKEAYLVELFPREGESYPRRRFPGFTGPWEEKKLGDVADIVMGQSPSSANYTDNPSDHILVQGNADMKKGRVYPRVWTRQVTKQAKKNDLILSVRAPVGDIGITDYDVVLGRGVAAIRGNKFIYYLLKKMKYEGYWTSLSTGSTFESINSNDIKNAEFLYPSLEEQKKIGDFFQRLDGLIVKEEERLDKLENLKKAYLNELFV